MSEIFELSGFARAERQERSVVLPFTPVETKESVSSLVHRVNAREPLSTPLPLIKKLCEALNAQQINYCHWKSNWKLKRWLAGDGDLDLLVDRADKQRFISLVSGLGFKQTIPASDRQVPGVLHFYGFDGESTKLVHLDVQFKLVIGHDLTTNYHLPAESVYLENSYRQGLLPTPAPEAELIVFVLRTILKHSATELLVRGALGKHKTAAKRAELEFLESGIDPARLANILTRLAPSIDLAFFERCLQSLRRGNSLLHRALVRRQLTKRLATSARRSRLLDSWLQVQRGVTGFIRERLRRHKAGKSFAEGGLLIAVIGGDGAGKTTVLAKLNKWLSNDFAIRRFHLGKPPRSLVTLALIVMLRIIRRSKDGPAASASRPTEDYEHNFLGYVQLLRWVSAGRDRRRVYVKARRFATNGGIAVCDRFPIRQLQLMDGPNIAQSVLPHRRNKFVKLLNRLELHYYRHILPPDLLIVLRVDPDIAVQRKIVEREEHVRPRSTELWKLDWQGTSAKVIDAGQSVEDVLAEAQSIIWASL